ncbi:unnamed protein product [Ixodes persulcatus]
MPTLLPFTLTNSYQFLLQFFTCSFIRPLLVTSHTAVVQEVLAATKYVPGKCSCATPRSKLDVTGKLNATNPGKAPIRVSSPIHFRRKASL